MSALRRRARAAQRGLTVYVVLLVIAMLSAVGIFASKSASLAVAQAGQYRQATQTHYMTEYAVHSTLAAIATDPAGYVTEFEEQDATYFAEEIETDADSAWRACRTAGLNQRCYKFMVGSIEERMDQVRIAEGSPDPDVKLLQAPVMGSTPLGEAGSLGRSDIEARFVVEATDLAQIVAPIEGERASESPLAFFSVTLSATGQVGPRSQSDDTDEEKLLRSVTTSVETARVHVTLGPLPAR